jgi:hypothetical protein
MALQNFESACVKIVVADNPYKQIHGNKRAHLASLDKETCTFNGFGQI